MQGIVTIKDIQEIFEVYGLAVAVRATYWTGTYLSFLVMEGLI